MGQDQNSPQKPVAKDWVMCQSASGNTMFLDYKAEQLNAQETTLHHIALNIALEDFESEKMRLEGLGLKVDATLHE